MSLFKTVLRDNLRHMAKAWWVMALAACLTSPALADPPALSSNRFLFIIDTSSSMKRWEEPLRDTVFDLLYSGIRGYMTNGDSYGVWLSAGINDTSSSVEVWRQKFATELASRIALRVKDAGCKGKPALDVALADAARVAATVGDVTVILVSNGETPLRGTPFDAEVNTAIQAIKPAMMQAKATVNTTLVARDGKFIGWSINSPEFLVGMPALPPRQVAAQRPQEPATTASDAPAPATAPKVSPPQVRVASKPIIITRETVDREKEATRALASTLDAPLVKMPIPPTTVTETSPVAAPPTPATATAASEQPVPMQAPTNTNIAAASPTPPPTEEAPSNTAPKEELATALPATAPPVESDIPSANKPVLWVAGAVVAIIAVALIVARRRCRPPHQSLVSEAIALERLYKPRS